MAASQTALPLLPAAPVVPSMLAIHLHSPRLPTVVPVLHRFKVIDMLQDYQMGPFTVTPLRVTHSIPDCCGLIMRRWGMGGGLTGLAINRAVGAQDGAHACWLQLWRELSTEPQLCVACRVSDIIALAMVWRLRCCLQPKQAQGCPGATLVQTTGHGSWLREAGLVASCDRSACVCFLFLSRSDHGTIVHTGDWKIDENPVDGQAFDRTTFDLLSEWHR